jgi:hypothetical protein
MLSEKFPGVRMLLAGPAAAGGALTGIAAIDAPPHGGLPKGALTEVVCGRGASGSATLMRQLLVRAAEENEIVAVIDGNDSLDVTSLDAGVLSRLLWIRCRSANDALKAADLVLRDGNLPLVLLDLKLNSEKELQKIPVTTWYRFQRLVQETTTVCVAFTPRPMLFPAVMRIDLHSQFSIAALDGDAPELLRNLKVEVSGTSQAAGVQETLQSTA